MSDEADAKQLVTLKIKFKSDTPEHFISRYAQDVSPGGIFIRTKKPLAPGTMVRFDFQLAGGTSIVSGEGTVAWIRELDVTRPNAAAGMGLRFDRLVAGSQEMLDRILAEKASQPRPLRSSLPAFDAGATPPRAPNERAPFEEATKVHSMSDLAAQSAKVETPAATVSATAPVAALAPAAPPQEADRASEQPSVGSSPASAQLGDRAVALSTGDESVVASRSASSTAVTPSASRPLGMWAFAFVAAALAAGAVAYWFLLRSDTVPAEATVPMGAITAAPHIDAAPNPEPPPSRAPPTMVTVHATPATTTLRSGTSEGTGSLAVLVPEGAVVTVAASAPGHLAQTLAVDSKRSVWNMALAPKPRRLVITSEPPGATVFVAGEKQLGVTPLTMELSGAMASRSEWPLRLQLSGFRNAEVSLGSKDVQELADAFVLNYKVTLAARRTRSAPPNRAPRDGGSVTPAAPVPVQPLAVEGLKATPSGPAASPTTETPVSAQPRPVSTVAPVPPATQAPSLAQPTSPAPPLNSVPVAPTPAPSAPVPAPGPTAPALPPPVKPNTAAPPASPAPSMPAPGTIRPTPAASSTLGSPLPPPAGNANR